MGTAGHHEKNVSLAELASSAIRAMLSKAGNRTARLKVPKRSSGDRISKGMHFHLYPEMFMQISGCTRFTFPSDSFSLMPGEICIIPEKVGHAEKALPHRGIPFRNLVLMTNPSSLRMHVADSADERPRGLEGISCDAPVNSNRLIKYMDDICEIYFEGSRARPIVGSLLKSVLLLIMHTLGKRDAKPAEDGRIAQCKSIVAASIGDPSMNVRKIASLLKCSPDYLSHRFHGEAGIRLSDYINQQRTGMAKDLLRSSALSIKEIAWACGYGDPGYFARVFSEKNGMSPRAYRKKLSTAG